MVKFVILACTSAYLSTTKHDTLPRQVQDSLVDALSQIPFHGRMIVTIPYQRRLVFRRPNPRLTTRLFVFGAPPRRRT